MKQYFAVRGGIELHAENGEQPQQHDMPLLAKDCTSVQKSRVGDEGLEPESYSSEKSHNLETSAAKSDALAARYADFDANLQAVIDAWTNLSQADRNKIMAIAETANH